MNQIEIMFVLIADPDLEKIYNSLHDGQERVGCCSFSVLQVHPFQVLKYHFCPTKFLC